jgi:nicotinic acid mononucleotide adenylyltransferase
MKNKFVVLGCVVFSFILVTFAYIGSKAEKPKEMTGVYWGAFNPLTPAHEAIITTASSNHSIKKLFVVVNNNSYKNYSSPLEERIAKIQAFIEANHLKNVEVLTQDDANQVNDSYFKERKICPICAIAGYDSYRKWVKYSKEPERAQYDAIAVIPRGDAAPLLFDKKAFLLPIDPTYKYVSSTKMRESLKKREEIASSPSL